MSRSLTSILPTLLGIAGLLSYAPQNVEGHAYMMAPVSRNLYATTAFVESSYPDVNYCPHCFQSRGPMAVRTRAEENTDPVELAIYGGGAWPHLGAYERGELASNGNYFEPDAIAVRHGICGDPEQTAAEGSNRYGKDNSNYPVLETYAEGSVMEMKVVMSTYHWGHLEFFICNSEDMSDSDGVVNQGCFNMHPLDRAEDDEDASPIDPKHRGRYYVDPSCRVSETDQTMVPGAFAGDVVTARYQLPEGLTCSRCIVQMVYYTGNSCKHPGYDEFDPPSWPSECAPAKENWISTGLSMCGDGDSYPEEFWNCADVEITSDGTSSGPSPSPEPETEEPTPTPVAEPTYMPHYTEYEPTAEPAPEPSPTSEPTAADAEEPTPMPAYMPIDNTPVPTFEWEKEPTPEPTYELDGFEPTPMPQGEEPNWYDKPIAEVPNVLTLAPATFAPSVPAPAPDGDCKDPAGAFAQCGGNSYEGPNCCRSGWECTELADCYSQCRPIDGRCSEGWGQCGGNGWDGPTCCWPGAECLERNEWYSQCVPETHN